MFGSSSHPPSDAAANIASIATSENRFSLIELRRIYVQLVENKSVNDENKSLVVEILRIIAEMVVYGDNKSELLFDFFCEKNMLSLFLEIMWTEGGCPSVVHIQILQTLSILINCVRNDTSLYYLLSNNYINEIIIYPFAFATDENLCDQFASFMKSLSLKLNIQTVQFFFIEETGAFPILTRAIGLLDVASEPMVRISSQSTILNVYKVEDSRAREYALQEEVMHSLFVNIVSLMKSQHASIVAVCLAYFAETDELKQNKLENQLEDIIASTEDWFYYLQDIMDLKILVLRQALIHHLLNEFVYPVLLQPLVTRRSTSSEAASSATNTPSKAHASELVMRSLEIEFSNSQKSGSGGSNSHSKALLDSTQRGAADKQSQQDLLTTNVSLVYFLQMMRFITDSLFQRSALVMLYHPLSQAARRVLVQEVLAAPEPVEAVSSSSTNSVSVEDIAVCLSSTMISEDAANTANGESQVMSSVETPTKQSASSDASLDSTSLLRVATRIAPPERNAFEEALRRMVSGQNQKLVLTSLFLFHLLCAGLVAGNPSRTVEGENYFSPDLLTPVQMVRLLQCMQVLPRGVLTAEDFVAEAKEEIAQDDSALPGPLKSSNSADLSAEKGSGSPQKSTKNDRHKNSRNSKKLFAAANTYAHDPDLLSLPMFMQISNRTLSHDHDSSHRPFLSTIIDTLRQSSSNSLTSVQVAAHTVYVVSNLVHEAFSGTRCADTGVNSGKEILRWILGEVKTAVQFAARTLSIRTNGPQAEVLLILLREEMRRYEGKKWKVSIFRMYGDILLFLPSTPSNMRRMGIDFDLPISQVESIRKDIQCFLVLRVLYKHITELAKLAKGVVINADLCASIKDQDFLGISESNIVPHNISDGASYDMRGKRFLDSVLVNSGANQAASGSSSSGGSSLWASSASYLSLGYLGGKKSSSNGPGTPPGKVKRSESGSSKQAAAAAQNILFIQEPAILLLIAQDKSHNKIGFKVFAAVPLLFTDAKIDPDDKRKFKVLVRSWKNLPQMCRVEPDGVLNDEDSLSSPAMAAIHKTRRGAQSEGFRKPAERSSFYSLTLAMETEQACMLAVQHIESKRQELFQQKILRLKGILNTWASESPLSALDDI